jgi:hypothetical protein
MTQTNFESQPAHLTHLTHLTDEQFSDLLLGANPPAVREHLKTCTQCSEEADRVSGAIGSFEQQTRLWAERRAATQPSLAADRQAASAWFNLAWFNRPQAWTAAAALMIALAAGIGLSHRADRQQPVQQQTATAQPAAGVSPATLKADNDLLSAIDGELRADESTPATVYGLTVSSHSRARSAKRIANE